MDWILLTSCPQYDELITDNISVILPFIEVIVIYVKADESCWHQSSSEFQWIGTDW